MLRNIQKFFLTLVLMLLVAAPAYADVWLPSGVTTIEDQAFSGASWLSGHCNIPEGVTTIGSDAFQNCSNLSQLTIPSSVTTIGARAFQNCSGLTGTVILPKNAQVAADAFEGCTNLTVIIEGAETEDLDSANAAELFTWTVHNGEVTITEFIGDRDVTEVTVPSTIEGQPVTAIDDYAFASNRNLTSVELPATLTTIGDRAFASCIALKKVVIPASVRTIGKNAFYFCTKLQGSVNLIDANIASNAFSGTKMIVACYTSNANDTLTLSRLTGNTADLAIPATVAGRQVTTIGAEAFAYSTHLESIELPAGLTTIEDSAFYYCSSLKHITLPETVTEIGNSAFRHCAKLYSIHLPASVSTIGSMAFANCNRLTGSITLIDVNTGFGAFSNSGDLEIFAYRTNGFGLTLESVISTATAIDIPANINGMNVTDMAPMAFYDCYDLTHLTLPATFTSICAEAFADQFGLTSISIPASITAIGDRAFENCESLESVTLHSGIRTVGERAFYGCTGLNTLTINSMSTVLEAHAFYGCTSLATINMPEGFSNVGNFALTNTKWLNRKVASIANTVTRGCSTEEQMARKLHDWVVNNCAYDQSYTYYGVEGILFHGTGVCNTYTTTYQMLLTSVGISSHIVTGTATNSSGATGSHAWNLVNLSGDWYHIDTTWDDPMPDGNETTTYYCMTDMQLAVNHSWNTASFPAATGHLYGAAANAMQIASK